MLPLKNVRVLDLTILRNFTAMELSDHGAEVIKIEQPGCGDPVRTMPPFHRDAALYHSFVNRGKKSVTLDITKSEGKQVFLDLVKTADVVLENFESGTMENLGLGYDVLSAVNPKLVYARLSAFGDNGPCKNYTGSDIVAQARGGCMDITGFPAPNPPYQVGTYVSEHYASTFLSGAIMLALFHARATGIGQKVETSLFDAAFSATEDRVAMVDKSNTGWSRTGNAHPSINPYDIYKCKTGYVAIGLSYDKMKKVNPQIIFGSISGFGQNGPLCKKPCYDVIATARSGVLDRTGGEDGVPIKPGFSLGDNWTGTNLFFGIGMALLNRQATGMGCRIDLAMLDSCLYMLEEPVLEYFANGDIAPRSGNFSATIAPYGMFQAKDGYITISCVSEEKWHDLCKALPLAHLLENPDYADNALRVKNRDTLKAEIEHVTAEWDKLELEAMLQKQHIAAGAVMSMPDLLKDEQTNARELAPVVQHPRIGSFRTMGIPIKLSKTPGSVHTRPAPGIGEHTVEVLEDLGYAPEYIQSLLNSGAVAQ